MGFRVTCTANTHIQRTSLRYAADVKRSLKRLSLMPRFLQREYMLANSGLKTAPCGVPLPVGCQYRPLSITPLVQERFNQGQQLPIANPLPDQGHQSVLWDVVEVTLYVRVHDPDLSFLE